MRIYVDPATKELVVDGRGCVVSLPNDAPLVEFAPRTSGCRVENFYVLGRTSVEQDIAVLTRLLVEKYG